MHYVALAQYALVRCHRHARSRTFREREGDTTSHILFNTGLRTQTLNPCLLRIAAMVSVPQPLARTDWESWLYSAEGSCVRSGQNDAGGAPNSVKPPTRSLIRDNSAGSASADVHGRIARSTNRGDQFLCGPELMNLKPMREVLLPSNDVNYFSRFGPLTQYGSVAQTTSSSVMSLGDAFAISLSDYTFSPQTRSAGSLSVFVAFLTFNSSSGPSSQLPARWRSTRQAADLKVVQRM